jgi:hypothetical protein
MGKAILGQSTPSHDGKCFFSRLPRKLRGMVYSKVLSAAKGTFIQVGRDQNPENNPSKVVLVPSIVRGGKRLGEVNQMRYVSRQLRQETEGIVLKVNEVNFDIRSGLNHLNLFLTNAVQRSAVAGTALFSTKSRSYATQEF